MKQDQGHQFVRNKLLACTKQYTKQNEQQITDTDEK